MTLLQIFEGKEGWQGGGGAQRAELRDHLQHLRAQTTWWRLRAGPGELKLILILTWLLDGNFLLGWEIKVCETIVGWHSTALAA